MKIPQAVLSVTFRSSLLQENLMIAYLKDLEKFSMVPGLLQKYYLLDEVTGVYTNMYFFRCASARDAFWSRERIQIMAHEYGVIKESLRVKQYELTISLN